MRLFAHLAAAVGRCIPAGPCLFLTALGFVLPASIHAYVLEGPRWPSNQPVVMYLQLEAITQPLTDGAASYDAVAASALGIWNSCLGSGVQFTVGTGVVGDTHGDSKNTVFCSNTAFGAAFGDDTLAVTVYITNSAGSQFTESDVIVNLAARFDSYRGDDLSAGVYDLRRVLLHEFGHVLGLAHVDQSVVAIMTPVISSVDTIEADDIAGVEAIYGAVSGNKPVVTSALSAGFALSKEVLYRATASNSPICYDATGLPGGLEIDHATGVISGTPTSPAGTYDVKLTATNAVGTGMATLALSLGTVPVITGSSYVAAPAGAAFTYQITATGSGITYSISGFNGGPVLDECTVNPTTGLVSGVIPDGYDFVVVGARNIFGSATMNLELESTLERPVINGVTSISGVACVDTYNYLTVSATQSPTSYGAAGLPPGLSISSAGAITGTPTTVGSYNVTLSATNAAGTTTYVWPLQVVSSFFDDAMALSGSSLLRFSNGNAFGYYAYLSDPHYIYHFDMGYEYVFDADDGQNGAYFYDFTSGGFFYSSPTFGFPYLYDFSLNSVVYYYPDPTTYARYNTSGVRYFYVFATGQIISK